MSGITPNSISNPSFVPENREINAVSKGYLEFNVNSLVDTSDQIVIDFPASISVSTLEEILIVNGFITDSNPIISGQTVTTSGLSAVSSSTVTLEFTNITNPPSETTTESFGIKIMRNNYEM